jgi:hypothetical protein
LHILHGKVNDFLYHESLAPFSSQDEQAENRIAVDVGNALHAANAHAFQEQLQDVHGAIRRESHLV